MYTYSTQETVSTRDLAWDVAGTSLSSRDGAIVDGAMTAAVALDKAGLANWNVRSVPLVTSLGDGGGDAVQAMNDAGIPVPGQFANLADINGKTKVLGVVGNRYHIFQNEETIDFLDAIVDESGAHFVAAGSLAEHRKMFAVMKMPNGILVGGQDASDLYFGITTAHDGSGSLVAWTTALRLRCTNMLNSSMRGADSKWSLRHTSGMRGKVQQARESLRLTFAWAEEFNRQAEEFLNTPFSMADFDKMVDILAPASDSKHEGWQRRATEKRSTLRFLFNDAPTNEFGRGTKWGAYNAFTEYADHYLPVKGADANGVKRAERILDGAATNMKQGAFDLLVRA